MLNLQKKIVTVLTYENSFSFVNVISAILGRICCCSTGLLLVCLFFQKEDNIKVRISF